MVFVVVRRHSSGRLNATGAAIMIATTFRRPCCFLSGRLFVVEVAGLIAGYFGPTFPADQLYFLPNAPDPGSPSIQPLAAGLLLFLGLDLIEGLSAFFHQFGHLVGGVGFPET